MADLPKGQGVFMPPFKSWLASNIPAVYDNTMTYYEELCALIKYLETQVVPALNHNAAAVTTISKALEQLKQYVDHYFDNLDIQEEVDKKLDQMAEDGTLENLIGSLLNSDFFNKSNTIGFHRIMRELIPTSNNPDYSESDYSTMQGGCYTKDNEFVQCSIRYDGTNNVKVRVIDLTTGELLRSAVLQMQHANGVTYNPNINKLYVTSLVTGSTNTHYVYVVDYDSLNIERTLDLTSLLETTEGTHSISYDNVTGNTILCTEFRNTNVLKFYYMNMSDGSLTHIPLEDYHNMLSKPSVGVYGTNDICVNNNILYILKHIPNVIVKYDLVSGKCIYVYNCQQFLRYGVFVGELESISINPITNDFYLSSVTSETRNGWYNIYNYLITNFTQGIDDENLNVGTGIPTIYVDSASTSINPTGEEGQAYKTIGEALQMLNVKGVKCLNITLKRGTYPFVTITNSKKVIIRPSQTLQENNYIINGITGYGANFFITNVTIDGDTDNDIYLYDSEATITWCKVSDKDKQIRIQMSILHAEQIRDANGVKSNVQSDNVSVFDSHDETADYVFTDSFPSRTQNFRLGTVSAINSTGSSFSFASNKKPFTNNYNVLILRIVKDNSFVEIPFTASSTTATKYICGIINGVIVRFQVDFDVTENTISFKILSAIQITTTTPTNVLSGLSYTGGLYLAK